MSWRAADIHAAVGAGWPDILERLGVDPTFLRNRHGPCPACGGRDRFRFDNKFGGGGSWICNQCGAGDGFKLLQLVHGWTFREARDRVLDVLGVASQSDPLPHRAAAPLQAADEPARPSRRMLDILRTSCSVEACAEAIAYLESRALWPMPVGHTLRAHAALDYWDELTAPTGDTQRVHVGRFAALIAEVRDIAGELVTLHVTYLRSGQKLQGHVPRKILGAMHGRRGLAVRLMPLAGDMLGIGEGIETCLAAHSLLERIPTWSALNAALLGKFEPPPQVRHVIAFCDADRAGYEAWDKLRENLDGRATCERRTPPAPANDWADVLAARSVLR